MIVGAGAAGAILANRLTEDGRTTVCLLEAGPTDRAPYLHIPAGFIKVLFDPALTWQYSSEPTPETNGRRVPLPQGRVLGGSTSINGMVYNRGQRDDYDEWRRLGNPGWGYADVLPYFKRTERRLGVHDGHYRGRDGPLPVTDIDWIHPVCEQFIAGAQTLGLPRNPDYNGASQAGVGYFQRTIDGRWRVSTSRAYLRPARGRANLVIRTHAHATALVFDGRTVTGVRYTRGPATATSTEVRARREVIVCAGALNTPKLLQLSGLGPGDLLQQMGVPVVQDLPGVGANLRDHYSVRLVAGVQGVTTLNELSRAPRLWGQVARWLLGRPNILALSPSLVHWFWNTGGGARPDVQGVFAPASYREGYVGKLDVTPGMTCGVWQHRPHGSGTVTLRSPDPYADPRVQPRYLSDARDRAVLLAGIRMARKLLQTPALARYATAETLPGAQVQSDDELLDFARRYGVSSYHVCGTARLGPAGDALAVVDAQLKVRGVTALRVVDSSVLPTIPSANTCAATMMVAEKAADLLLGKPPLPSEDPMASHEESAR